jgi:hypothetical protein
VNRAGTAASDPALAVRPNTIRAIRAIAEATFATRTGPPPAARLEWLDGEVADFLARSGSRSRFLFAFMVFVVSAIAPLLIARLPPLRRLPLAERIVALSRLERRFAEPLLAVKAILCLIYYEHPEAAREVGFDGACLTGLVSGRSPTGGPTGPRAS